MTHRSIMRHTPALAVLAIMATACSPSGGTSSKAAGAPSQAPRALPFATAEKARFDEPFALAFLPDGRVLVTEKAGRLKLWAAGTRALDVAGVAPVARVNQGGLLDVALSPDYANDHHVYLTYSEPGPGGSSLALARAVLVDGPSPRLDEYQVIWRQEPRGRGGQFGAVIAFSPDGQYLFLASGERQRKTPAQDPDQALGKIIRLSPSGGIPGDNPSQNEGRVRAETWSTGHRNPYGLAFAADGRLWETEMGPMGGDELNVILPAKNYGWPRASNGSNYDGSDIPDHRAGDGFEAPKLWWNPSISPGGFMIYSGKLFPAWKGSGFIAALSGEALIRVTLTGDTAAKADTWPMGERLRDVAEAPDGAIWVLEDGGRLMRLTPEG